MSAVKPKILVIRGGAIGDFILTLPAIAALRRQFPQAHLEVLGYPHIAQLAVAGGLADRVQPIEARGLAGFFARGGTLEPDLMDYFSEFDLVISYLYDPDEIFKTNVCRCLVGQFIVGPHRPDEAEQIHATKVYLKPLERLAIFDADPVPRLPSTLNSCAANALRRLNPQPTCPPSRQRQRKEKLAGNEMGRVDSTNRGDNQLEPAAGWRRGGGRTPATAGGRIAAGAMFRSRKACRLPNWHNESNPPRLLWVTIRASRTWRRRWDCRALSCGRTRWRRSGGRKANNWSS